MDVFIIETTFVSIVRVEVMTIKMRAHAGENPAAVDCSELQQVSM